MAEDRVYLQLFHSTTPGAIPPTGLLPGEVGLNVADNLEFIGYGGDISYDINGNPYDLIPPAGMGYKTYGIGGDGPPGPPGPAGQGVPEGGETGQYLVKATDGDYVTVWADGPDRATSTTLGLVYGSTEGFFENENTTYGYGALSTMVTGERNVALGFQSGLNVDPSFDNVFIGYQSAFNIDGNENVIIGSQACGVNPGGAATGNVVLGYQAGINATSANYNVLIGHKSGFNIRGGDNNTIVGSYAGSADLQGYVVLSDGQGNVRFLSNSSGAWAPDGVDTGLEGQVLVSQGDSLPPKWEVAPDAGVTQVVAGNGIVVSPESGTGVVTVSFDGDPDAGVESITSGTGILFRNAQGLVVSSITSTGTILINEAEVLTPALYSAGTILVGGLGATTVGGVYALQPGQQGQVLAIDNGFPVWSDINVPGMAQPNVAGIVFGLTDGGPSANVALGLGAGSALLNDAGKNTFIGAGAGSNINTGDANVILGAYRGFSDLSNNIVLSDGDGTVRLQINEFGAISPDGTDFGQSGYVLSSNGPGAGAQWIDPPNAPIQDLEAGTGIQVDMAGTTATISNTGVTSLAATAPLQVSDDTGAVTISAPNVITTLNQGSGITITGTGNTRTVANSGVVTLENGNNTVAVQVSPGVWKIDAAGGPAGIVDLQEGAGINITDPSGPSPLITNDGVISVAASANIVPSATKGAGITFSLQNVVLGATAGPGISITGTASNPVINNTGIISLQDGTGTTVQNVGNGVWQVNSTGTAGVTKLIAGDNISLSPSTGVGEVTITAAGGGGGGSITEILAGPGINVLSPTGPNVTIQNTGIRSIVGSTNRIIAVTSNGETILDIGSSVLTGVTAGTGITVSGTGNSRQITNSGVTSLTAGAGISLSGGTGNVTITATGGGGGGVDEIKSSNAFLEVQSGTGPVVTLTNKGVNKLTAGTGITLGGTDQLPTISISSAVLTSVTAGDGISITGEGNTRRISNAGVVSISPGTGIEVITSGTNRTINNKGVTKIVAGSNITVTNNGIGQVTISASGGGGGSGTVTKIETGPGLTGGPITTSGTIGLNTNESNNDAVITWGAFNRATRGSILYSDTSNHDWSGGLSLFSSESNPMQLIGYFGALNIGTYVEWAYPKVAAIYSSDSIDVNGPQNPIDKPTNSYFPYVKEDWLKKWIAQTLFYDTGGGSLTYLKQNSLSGGPSWDVVPFPIGLTNPVLSYNTANQQPFWTEGGGGSTYTVTAPITLSGPNNTVIGFNTATTALTAYVPKSAYTAKGSLVVGSGAGAYSTLAPGTNGQILSVDSTGALKWIAAPTPGSSVSITAADTSIIVTPSPITGTGTIKVNATKFISSTVLTSVGDMIIGSGNPVAPARLAKGANGSVLQVSDAGAVGWSDVINGGTY